MQLFKVFTQALDTWALESFDQISSDSLQHLFTIKLSLYIFKLVVYQLNPSHKRLSMQASIVVAFQVCCYSVISLAWDNVANVAKLFS